MLQHILRALGAILLLLGSTGTAYAYLEPEDVLYPINSRRAEQMVIEREAERMEKHTSAPEEEVDPTEEEETEDPEITPEDLGGETFFLDEETARLLERLSEQASGNPTILHPGADLMPGTTYPLAPTGPGSIALAVTLLGTCAFIGYKVYRLERHS